MYIHAVCLTGLHGYSEYSEYFSSPLKALDLQSLGFATTFCSRFLPGMFLLPLYHLFLVEVLSLEEKLVKPF